MSIDRLKLSWRNLSLEDSTAKAIILNDINGETESGQFLSIMGPSGAGKSSLLSILSCRLRKDNTKLIISGDVQIVISKVHLNGGKYDLNDFSRLATYVQQDDVLFGTLTVKQTFQFHSRLKLWRRSQTEQIKKTESLLKKLNLMECADALVGSNQFKKGISGGQKKRVAIGVQLISNPYILIFDEPTSGLDSHNALVIMRLLGKLAKQQQKLVIATIHQPSTLIFQEMDQLLLLKKGQCVYKGLANSIVPYMQKIGIRVDYRMNPADFFMMEISQFKEQNGYKTALNSSNCKIYLENSLISNAAQNKSTFMNINLSSQQPALRNQFHALFSRSFKAFIRSPSNQLNKLVTAFLIPGFLGLLFKNIGNQVPDAYDQTYLFKIISLLFMANFFVFSMNVYDTTLIFPNQKQIVCKEAGANLYSLPIYFISRMMTEILGSVVPAIICSTIIYLACGFDFSGYHFPIFMGVLVSMGLCGYLFGLFFGVLNKDSVKAINILPLVVIPMMIYGGLVVNLDTIPQYSRWLQYVSPMRHSFTIIFQDQLKSDKMATFQPYNLPRAFGLDGDPGFAFLYIIGLSVLYIACSIVILMVLKKRL